MYHVPHLFYFCLRPLCLTKPLAANGAKACIIVGGVRAQPIPPTNEHKSDPKNEPFGKLFLQGAGLLFGASFGHVFWPGFGSNFWPNLRPRFWSQKMASPAAVTSE